MNELTNLVRKAVLSSRKTGRGVEISNVPEEQIVAFNEANPNMIDGYIMLKVHDDERVYYVMYVVGEGAIDFQDPDKGIFYSINITAS